MFAGNSNGASKRSLRFFEVDMNTTVDTQSDTNFRLVGVPISVHYEQAVPVQSTLMLPPLFRFSDVLLRADGTPFRKRALIGIRNLASLNAALSFTEEHYAKYVDYMRRASSRVKNEPAKPPVAKAADGALDTDSMWPADTPLVYLAIGAYSWDAEEEDPGCTINAQSAARQGLILGASLSTVESRAHAQILAPAALPEAISSAAVWQMRHLVDAAARDGTDILFNLLSNPDGIHIAIESDSWEGHMLVRPELREPNYVWSMAQNVASYAKARGVRIITPTTKLSLH